MMLSSTSHCPSRVTPTLSLPSPPLSRDTEGGCEATAGHGWAHPIPSHHAGTIRCGCVLAGQGNNGLGRGPWQRVSGAGGDRAVRRCVQVFSLGRMRPA